MRSAAIGVAVLGLLVGLCASVQAEGLPWVKPPEKAGGNPPAEANPLGEVKAPVADKPAIDLEKELPPALYTRAIKPVIAQMEVAKKYEGLADKELEKPEKQQLEKRALGYKDVAAKAYLGASLKAKQAVNLVKEPSQKDAIIAQYEKPCRDSAVALYLAIAEAAFKHRDLRTTVAYYQQVLKIDPENQTAKDELEKIKKAVAQAMEDSKKGNKGEGGDSNLIDIQGDISRKSNPDPGRDSGIPGRDPNWFRKSAGTAF